MDARAISIDLKELRPRRHAKTVTALITQHKDWCLGAEIGVAQGRTSLAILAECKHVALIAVEPFCYIADSEKSGLYQDFDFAYNEACVRAVAAQYGPRLKLMKMTSLEAALQIKNDSLDFVFIDANHHYAEAREDILAWSPKVKRGGWIMGHDYSIKWPGVMRAVDELHGVPLQFDETVWAIER